jgi:hypothetical protein
MDLHGEIDRRSEIVMGDTGALEHAGIVDEAIDVARYPGRRRRNRDGIRKIDLIETGARQIGRLVDVPDNDLMPSSEQVSDQLQTDA